MTQHSGLPVPGYRPQSDEKVGLVTESKHLEEQVLRFMDRLAKAGHADPRWFAIGRTGLEQAFMAINRSVFQPTRIALPEDGGIS